MKNDGTHQLDNNCNGSRSKNNRRQTSVKDNDEEKIRKGGRGGCTKAEEIQIRETSL